MTLYPKVKALRDRVWHVARVVIRFRTASPRGVSTTVESVGKS